MQVECWIYARISDDPREQRRGVERQLRDLRAHAQQQGWEVRGEFHDNDISAHKDEDRPGYNDLMDAVLAAMPQVRGEGKRGVILGLHPSRLWRRRVERAQAIEDLRQAKACVAFETGGFFDMSKATERSQLANLGESDTLESEVKAERVAREALARAEEGRANGAVQYGWRRVYKFDDRGRQIGFEDVKDETYGPVVEEVIDRLDRAETLISIYEDLNERGVLPPGAHLQFKKKKRAKGNEDGTKWNKTSVKKLALRPANAGLRLHKGELYPAAWPALVPREKWERVVARLTDPSRSVERDGQRKHLLSWGIGECGVCEAVLRVAKRGNRQRGKLNLLYVCDAPKSCVGRSEEYVDAWVGEVVIARLNLPDAADVFGADEEAAAAERGKAEALRRRLTEAADDYAEGILTREQLTRITNQLKPKIADHEAEAKRLVPQNAALLNELVGVSLEAAEAAWGALSVVQKREVLEVLNVRVRILPTGRRGPGFDPDYVEVLAVDGSPFKEYAPAA
ncbi:recombinase family protein [Streptomyces griseorubiginosus]|uniref:recombinase family protein n=1 Tax=Streptomyces griseorubiginosus TaxID=67304 RepID=UPI0033B47752